MTPDTDRPQTHASNPATADRRARARLESTRPIPRRIYLVETLEPLDAWIVDLSERGVGLVVSRPLPLGAVLFIELESAPDEAPVKVWAEVVRCAAAEDTNWVVGCEFINRLSADDLDATMR
jgi:hypothetical protein